MEDLKFEVLELYNHIIQLRQKPRSQSGITSYPDNYETNAWCVLSVRRVSDGVIMYKDITITDKGPILFFRVSHTNYNNNGYKACYINTALGEFPIDDIVVINKN